MEIRWDNYVGRDVNGFPLLALLGVRDDRAFFLTARNGADALLQAAVFNTRQLERWTTAARLSHPNLMAIFTTGELQFDEESPRIVYAVSPVPDDDMGEQLARGAFDRDRAAHLATDVANALDYLHGQGLSHGAVTPTNIFFVNRTVRLAADSIEPAGDREPREDLRQLGATLDAALENHADERLKTIITGTQSPDPSWTAGRVLQALAEPLTPPPAPRRELPPPVIAPPVQQVQRPPAAPTRAWVWITAVAAVVIALAIFVGARSRREPTAAASAPQVEPPTMFGQSASPAAPATTSPAVAGTRTTPVRRGWAVIAATYGAHKGAEKRAASIRERWPQFQPTIYPPAGEGRRYYVVLGSGLSKEDAENLHRRARRAGMPGDTYVTKLGG